MRRAPTSATSARRRVVARARPLRVAAVTAMTAMVMVAALLTGATPAAASPASDASDAPASTANAGKESVPYESPPPRARKLFEEARGMLDKGRYDSAAQLFRKALLVLDDPRRYLYGRAAVLSELYAAQTAAYNIDNDPVHLCELKDTLGDYTRALVDSFKDDADTLPELELAREHQDKLNRMLAEHAVSSPQYASAADVCPGRTLPAAPTPGAEEPPAGVALIDPDAPIKSEEPADEPRDEPPPAAVGDDVAPEGPAAPGLALNGDEPRDPTPLFVAGGVTTAVGVGLLAAMTWGFVQMDRADQQAVPYLETIKAEMRPLTKDERAEFDKIRDDFDRARTVAITTAVFGGVALIGGVTMLAIGKRQQNVARFRGVALLPLAGPRGGGLQLHMRF